MTTDFYTLLLSDALAVVLLLLFWYVQRISRGLRGIALWGVAQLVYSGGRSHAGRHHPAVRALG